MWVEYDEVRNLQQRILPTMSTKYVLLAICTTYYQLLSYECDECAYCLLPYEKCVVCGYYITMKNRTEEESGYSRRETRTGYISPNNNTVVYARP